MASPTRMQIEANLLLPKYKVEFSPSSSGIWYTVNNNNILNIDGDIKSTGSTYNGLSFGSYVEPSASISVDRRTVFASVYGCDDPQIIGSLIRISYGFDTSDFVPIYVGPIVNISVDGDDVEIKLGSAMDFVSQTKLYTAATYNTPIATRTTISSEENPNNPNYAGGTINRILWAAGGRPLLQRGIYYSDSDAKFWYDCEQSIFSPQWTWLNGENLVEELFLLARASGGQIYQSTESQAGEGLAVIRYVQPLTLADSSSYSSFFNFTTDMFESFSKTVSGYEKVGTVRCTFTQRRLYVLQTVYEDNTPRFLRIGQTLDVDLDTQLPVFEYAAINSANVKAYNNQTGAATTVTVTILTKSANRVTLRLVNGTGAPVTVNQIILKGRPLGVEEEGIATYGTGDPQVNIEDNPYIQTYGHAARLTRMVHDFYSVTRPIITLKGNIYDPDRFVGEIVRVNNSLNIFYNGSAWAQTTELYRIIGIKHSNTGTTMDIDLVPIGNLPDRNDMYIVEETYSSSDVRMLSY